MLRGPTGRIVAERREGYFSGNTLRGYKFDELGRLAEHRVDLATSVSRTTFLSNVNAALADDDIASTVVASPDATSTATFNKADSLTSVTADERGRIYSMQPDTTGYGTPPLNINGLSFSLDAQDRPTNDGTLTYTFDVLDRLVLVQRGALEELRIAYDGFGRRRLERRCVGSSASSCSGVGDYFLEYDGPNVIEETNTSNLSVAFGTTHAPAVDAPLALMTAATQSTTGTFFAFSTNARGDVVLAARLGGDP